jgi:hypothetical protein
MRRQLNDDTGMVYLLGQHVFAQSRRCCAINGRGVADVKPKSGSQCRGCATAMLTQQLEKEPSQSLQSRTRVSSTAKLIYIGGEAPPSRCTPSRRVPAGCRRAIGGHEVVEPLRRP